MIYLYMMIWSKMLVWLVVIGSKHDCKCTLLMTTNEVWFQVLLIYSNIMEVMCLVQECLKFPVVWSKLMETISSNEKINWNMQQYVIIEIQEPDHYRTLVPNYLHWFSWACYDQYNGFEGGICLGFHIFWFKETFPRDGSPETRDVKELGRWVTTRKGWSNFLRDFVAKKGRSGILFFSNENFHMESYAHCECTLEQWTNNCSLRGKVSQDYSVVHWMKLWLR